MIVASMIIIAILAGALAVTALAFGIAEADPYPIVIGVMALCLTGAMIFGTLAYGDGPTPSEVCKAVYHGAYTETNEGVSLCLVETRPT